MKPDERFAKLWNDYLEGELDEGEIAELSALLSSDGTLVRMAADSYQIHRLLSAAAQDNRESRESFVRETMAKLPVGDEEFVDGVMHRLPCRPAQKERTWFPRPKIRRLAVAAAAAVVVAAVLVYRAMPDPGTIARVTAVNGSVEWTTDGGRVRTDLRIGTPVHGGVLETLTHDSWVECAFLDGTKIAISGYSMVTLSEHERQKILHLREGNMFADVNPQPENRPMRVITRTAEAEVLGTKFQVACEQHSTSFRVREGLVLVRRLADGSTSKVAADHVIVAALEQETEFAPRPHKEFVTTWKASVRRDLGYGELRHAAEGSPASVYAKPLLWRGDDGKQEPRLLYTTVLNTRTATPILKADSSIKVRGRLREDALVVFGFTANHSQGGFAGKYSHVKRRIPATRGEECFEVEIPLRDFARDMGLEHYPESPVSLELHQCWVLTLNRDYGLDIESVELQN